MDEACARPIRPMKRFAREWGKRKQMPKGVKLVRGFGAGKGAYFGSCLG